MIACAFYTTLSARESRFLLGILEHPNATMPSLVWTMMAIAQIGPDITDQAHSALV